MNTNDRGLLKLAAKACVELTRSWYDNESYLDGILNHWNPLEDDCDAFRLAVSLGLTVHQWSDEVCVCNFNGTINESVAKVDDSHAATRRAIVLAAAEIAKNSN